MFYNIVAEYYLEGRMDKNVLVLSAMSGDQESFGKVYEKLKMYAYSVASELFLTLS